MINKITARWLKSKNACIEGIKLFESQKEDNPVKCLERLIGLGKLDYANWLITKLMNYKQRVEYAVFAADQVIDIFEKKYPDDDRPRQAIEAARKCIKNPSKKNKNASSTASASAYTAAYTAYTAYAAYAAYSAASAASSDASDASASADAYASAYASAYDAYGAYAYDAYANIKKKILLNGLKILEDNNEE